MKSATLCALLALPALAFALPSADDMIEAYKARLASYQEVLNPATKSPDNLIKRYTVFRSAQFKDMAERQEAALLFAWGEPIFFKIDQFIEEGDGDWLEDLEDYKSMISAGTNSVSVPCYKLWVCERADEDGVRRWVLAERDNAKPHALGDEIYAVDVEILKPDYAPHALANSILKACRITPARDDDGCADPDESMFMTLFYNMLDPARFRMAVNLMDYDDFLKLQNGGGGNDDDDDDDDDDGNGGGGGGAVTTNNFTVVELPYTNGFYFASQPYVDVYTHNAPTNGHWDTYFWVTNASDRVINISWATNSHPAGQFFLPAQKEVFTNVLMDVSAKITLNIPAGSTNNWYGFIWWNEWDL